MSFSGELSSAGLAGELDKWLLFLFPPVPFLEVSHVYLVVGFSIALFACAMHIIYTDAIYIYIYIHCIYIYIYVHIYIYIYILYYISICKLCALVRTLRPCTCTVHVERGFCDVLRTLDFSTLVVNARWFGLSFWLPVLEVLAPRQLGGGEQGHYE